MTVIVWGPDAIGGPVQVRPMADVNEALNFIINAGGRHLGRLIEVVDGHGQRTLRGEALDELVAARIAQDYEKVRTPFRGDPPPTTHSGWVRHPDGEWVKVADGPSWGYVNDLLFGTFADVPRRRIQVLEIGEVPS